MKVFDFTANEYRSAYQRDGWVHVKEGVDPSFFDYVQQFVAERRISDRLVTEGLAGEKDQLLFDFPPEVDCQRDLFDVLGPLTGLRQTAMTLSERHVKIYSEHAAPLPTAHKDRLSSQIAVGITVEVPPGSHLVLYPEADRWVNPFLSTGLRDSLEPDRLPEVVLAGAIEAEVHDAPGDVIVFPGSSMWHLRRRSAGTVNLYLKFNEFDADPLGEDPSTGERRDATLAVLAANPASLFAMIPALARRVDSIAHRWSRPAWRESRDAAVWGQAAVSLSVTEETVLRSVGDGRSVADLVAEPCALGAQAVEQAVRRLAACGVLDLRDPRSAQAGR